MTAMATLAALLATAVAVVLGAAVADDDGSSYYASVENRLPAAAGMELVCRALGGQVITEWSVVPRGRVPHGGRRVMELIVDDHLYGWVSCSWAYEGNYLGSMPLFDSRWADAKRCQDPAGGMCRVVFEHDQVRVETPGGGGQVIGDLPVKRCRRHWLLFSTECSYPHHPQPYAGRLLGNAFEYFGV